MMKRVAIIPARGGSKRLPRKNILPVFGRPMLSYPIKTAIESGMFDDVIVSTEDHQIKSVALEYGARAQDRPEELAQDRSTVVQVCTDVLKNLKAEGPLPEWFCCIYATALFLTPEDLNASFKLQDGLAPFPDVIMGVSRYNLQVPQALEKDDNDFLTFKWSKNAEKQSQFHPDFVASNGTFYWARTSAFLENPTFYADRLKGYEIPWIRAIDVDTPEDYDTVKLIASVIFPKKAGPSI